MPSYEEVMEAREAETATKPSGPTPQQVAAFMRESARGAAVLTELLDSPAWNVFTTIITGDPQRADAERAILRDRIESGDVVGDDRARADLRLQYLRGQIEAFTIALGLPKTLIGRHETLAKAAGNGDRDTVTAP
jgi:hypothetical protein